MPAADVAATLTRYARLAAAPVRSATTVSTVRTAAAGFEIQANDDVLHTRAVVLATGASIRPAIPAVVAAVPRSITTLTPLGYRDPGQLPEGGVLVVGASATGVQLAGEIHRSGRPVTLAVGEHVHLPSPQLIGILEPAATDLNALTAQGIRIVGRLGRITDGVAQFSGSLRNTGTLADLKMNRFLTPAPRPTSTARSGTPKP
jgi:putative flavoprotein involved in K+ transport